VGIFFGFSVVKIPLFLPINEGKNCNNFRYGKIETLNPHNKFQFLSHGKFSKGRLKEEIQ
jgi:hypothetical protein